MKFERIMQIYWAKGIYYNGRLLKNDWTLYDFINEIKGLGRRSRIYFVKKFELSNHLYEPSRIFHTNLPTKNKIFNLYLANITNTGSSRNELWRYNIIRLYLTKTFRGRAQALGKPSRGQRTWSNAWTSFNYNTTLKEFINEVAKHRRRPSLILKKKNYKAVVRKLKKKSGKLRVTAVKKTINLWF